MSMMTNFPTVHNATVVGELPIDAVLSLTLADHEHVYQGNTRLKIKRLKQFAIHGCKCYNCGREGNRILITIQKDKQHHVDLYHVEGTQAVMMNRDHIVPASLGGSNSVFNMRPACSRCNSQRGNHFSSEDEKLFRFRQSWEKYHLSLLRFGILKFLSRKKILVISKILARVF